MTAPFRPDEVLRAARRRRLAADALTGVPLALAAVAVAWRLGGPAAAAVVALAIAALGGAAAARRAGRFDRGWLIRRLDRGTPDLDDSADLLFADAARLTALAALQRERALARLAAAAPDLRPAWGGRRTAAAWVFGAVAAAAIVIPGHTPRSGLAANPDAAPAAPGVPRLTGVRVRVTPPPYTGLARHDAATLDLRAPQGSRLDWTLAFAPQPVAADLVFADGRRIALVHVGTTWTAHALLDRSALYRVVPPGAPPPPLHRLDAVADAPPQVRVVAPDRSLSLVAPGQRRWPLTFAATDDYGVATTAQLHLTIAEGEGESVKFRETVVTVRGTGGATARRFAVAPDLAALKFAAGGDLVAQLVVSDNRAGHPQTARSPSVILRWPGSEGSAEGMGGVVTRALPAYFRSERQIIIDAEALLKARPRLAPAAFLARSDTIAADQRLLRLRYGQFLGEEQEGTRPAPPTADAAAPPTAGAAAPPVADDGSRARPSTFGAEGATLEAYGHVHDEAEAATLVDPDTKTKLKGALDAMWQAELNLHQAQVAAALPFAYRALGLIKQVQQATRIFLAKVGPDLPPIDETRRLTGKRDGIGDRALPPVAADAADPTPAAAWRALANPAAPVPFATLDRWLGGHPPGVTDPLAVAAAIDAMRRDPGCADCRRALRAELWRAQPRPAAGVRARGMSDAAGRRYLDALTGGGR